jgi:predicted RNase H-like nuclease (RuvC/YqgF family)
LLWSACFAGKKNVAPRPVEPKEAVEFEAARRHSGELQAALDRLERTIERLRQDNASLSQEVKGKERELASLEERYAALEIDLASTVDEVLRSKASFRGVENRALATSRIAEARVLLQAVRRSRQKDVAERVRRAEEFLKRADQALTEKNYGGALYLAERAGELVRQVSTMEEYRSRAGNGSSELIPIVPPRELEVVVSVANLRRGPGLDEPRETSAKQGTRLTAVARVGSWYEVQTVSGDRAWIHQSVVR